MESHLVDRVVGIDPGLSMAYAVVAYVGMINDEDEMDNPDKYIILDFGKWNNGIKKTPLIEVANAIVENLAKIKCLRFAKTKIVIESQQGGRNAKFMFRNHNMAGTAFGYCRAIQPNTTYVAKSEKWPHLNNGGSKMDTKKERVKLVKRMLIKNGKMHLIAKFTALPLNRKDHHCKKAAEDVADAILMACCHMRKLLYNNCANATHEMKPRQRKKRERSEPAVSVTLPCFSLKKRKHADASTIDTLSEMEE